MGAVNLNFMKNNVYTCNFGAMGTSFGMVLSGIIGHKGDLVISDIREEIERIEEMLSLYDPGSEVFLLNQSPSGVPVEVSGELFKLIEECLGFNRAVCGAFDISLRVLTEYWNRIEKLNKPVNVITDESTRLLAGAGMDKVELFPDESKVALHGRAKLDFGGAGKGYALNKVSSILDLHGVENCFISFGDSSIMTRGNHPNGNCWKVGVPDPFNNEKEVIEKELKNCSVSTSGNTVNNSIRGRVNVINPFTGLPEKGMRTAFVSHKNPLIAEILSTAILILDNKSVQSVLEKFEGAEASKIEYINEKPEITEFTNKNL